MSKAEIKFSLLINLFFFSFADIVQTQGNFMESIQSNSNHKHNWKNMVYHIRQLKINNKRIKCIPLWKWLLE